jgi:two-component system KDP operon response regulator KdpE
MSLGVLLVEDDHELRATLRQSLAVEGYRVMAAASLADAWALWRNAPRDVGVDLVLLDLGLPDGDGADFLRSVRGESDLQGARSAPVIVISARHNEGEKVMLLDAGADDYLVKPFSISELLARMRVSLRHRGQSPKAAIARYVSGDVEVDLQTRSVLRAGQAVHLTPTEYDLLARLVRSAGQVVTHRQLLADVWGPEYTEHTHYLRLYMAQLRAKLERSPAEPELLLNEPGVGYRLAEPAP